MNAKTLFVTGNARVIGCPDGVVIKRLSKKQFAAAKIVVALGLDVDQMDDLETAILSDRQRQQRMAQIRRAGEVVAPDAKAPVEQVLDRHPAGWARIDS